MIIDYRELDDYLPVEIDKLRPKDSYKNLINKRTHSIDSLVAEYGKIPEDLLITRKCPTCQNSRFTKELAKDHLTLVRCKKCDLVYTNPIFDEGHYKETYRSSEYQEIVKDLGESSHEYRLERFGNERISIMKNLLPSGKVIKYLDIGCSTGFVVEAAVKSGWKATGIDLNPSAIEFGLSRGLDLINCSLEDTTFPRNSFDAISLFDVIEHVTNPRDILRQATDLLKPGGIVFLYVPNYDSASRILMGREAHFIWPTHHLNYYTPKTISDLIESEDLKINYLATEGLDLFDYIWYMEKVKGEDVKFLEKIANSLQFFVNAGCYGKNLRVIGSKPLV